MVALPLFQEDDGGSIPTSPLQLRFRSCSLPVALELNARWHSRFPYMQSRAVWNSACYVAQFENLILASAIWSRPIAANRMRDGDKLMELRRMAICADAPKNTASRMLGWMARELRRTHPAVIRLVSYQDVDAHDGTIYKASGWTQGPRSSFVDWATRSKAPGRVTQSTADKIRWEKQIR